MPVLKLADGEELYYEVHGAGPPLALVSGLNGLGGFWTP
ncbi:MAG: alpha/beta hydrolase, partial [Proteobacteria bacterium]|nr:alpha/beta hydrolase [Pseudomonadota bacterium]